MPSKRKPNKPTRVTGPSEFVNHINQRMETVRCSRYALAKAYEEKHGGQFQSHDTRLKRMLSGETSPDFLFVMRVCDMLAIEVFLKWTR